MTANAESFGHRVSHDFRHGRGYQHHHLLPLSLLNRQQIGDFLLQVQSAGLCLRDRRRNCLWLPADERLALATGRALHRGPHPHYTDVVAGRVERIRQRWRQGGQGDVRDSMERLVRLQEVMSRILLAPGPRLLHLNRRDPMRAFADYAYLDDAISRLFLPTQCPLPAANGA